MNDLPTCECAVVWPDSSHHPECPVRRLVETEREKVRLLREALDAISDSDPDESAGRLRDIANDGLQATAQEKTK